MPDPGESAQLAGEKISFELDNVLEERPGMLLVEVRFRTRGRESIEVDAPFFQLYLFGDAGLVREFEAFGDEGEARRAALPHLDG